MLDIVEAFGAQVRWDHEVLEVGPGTLQGIDLDLGNSPDLVPTVAVLASLSRGPTRIRNIAHLKLKESDRLQAVAIELTKAGARVEVQADSLKIWPGRRPTKTVHFASYNDHRLAMALAGYQLVGLPLEIDEPGCVAKSFPGFWDQWTTLVQAMEQSS
jgi:3-phosphoshikimate 1-carboxyvinyltransferase